MNIADIDELLKPLEQSIEGISNTLTQIRAFFEEKLKTQQVTINKLMTRMVNLETRLAYSEFLTNLHERKLDDYEQFSRKVNLKITGIVVEPNDSPEKIMNKIKDEATALNLEIEDYEYDRCHRVGRKYQKNGKTFQNVLLKCCFWRTRDIIYQNRKKISFKISADLTQRRTAVLDFAKDELDKDMKNGEINSTVKFVFSDKNCNLKICSQDNKFFTFNSEQEFCNIVTRLDRVNCCSDELLADESNGKKGEVIPYDVYY